MHERTLETLVVSLGLAACADPATGPQTSADAAPPAVSALSAVPEERMLNLTAALADARSRLLPAVGGERSASLAAAMQQLDARLAAEDEAGVLSATAQVEQELAAIPAGEAEAVIAELDAVRLALDEVRTTAAGPVPPPQGQ